MNEPLICDYVRTPIGRFGGALAGLRADDLAAIPLAELLRRHPGLAGHVDEVVLGCANQAGEDNRNVARMSLLLAGFPPSTPGYTVNRLCASGMDAVAVAARAVRAGDAEVVIAGGVESMTRAPFVMGKASSAFQRTAEIHDTTIGWRFVNPRMVAAYGVDSMPETAENVAEEFAVSRADQDAFALRSQERAALAIARGFQAGEIVAVDTPGKAPVRITDDEHPRSTTMAQLARLTPIVRPKGTVTAGNASGVNDGAAALLIVARHRAEALGLRPVARIIGASSAGVAPRVMGIGPVPATRTLLDRLGLRMSDFDVVELNEAFASQALATMRSLGLADASEVVNANGGAIALGHPLGMSGARIIGTAARRLVETDSERALATMCVGVGQGVAVALARM